jgi:hypothetical protein
MSMGTRSTRGKHRYALARLAARSSVAGCIQGNWTRTVRVSDMRGGILDLLWVADITDIPT